VFTLCLLLFSSLYIWSLKCCGLRLYVLNRLSVCCSALSLRCLLEVLILSSTSSELAIAALQLGLILQRGLSLTVLPVTFPRGVLCTWKGGQVLGNQKAELTYCTFTDYSWFQFLLKRDF